MRIDSVPIALRRRVELLQLRGKITKPAVSLIAPTPPKPKKTTVDPSDWKLYRSDTEGLTIKEIRDEAYLKIHINQAAGTSGACLHVRYMKQRIRLYILFNQRVVGGKTWRVSHQFDDEEPQSRRWNSSTSYMSIFQQNQFAFKEKFRAAEFLRVKFTGLNDKEHVAIFKLEGFEEAMNELEAAIEEFESEHSRFN